MDEEWSVPVQEVKRALHVPLCGREMLCFSRRLPLKGFVFTSEEDKVGVEFVPRRRKSGNKFIVIPKKIHKKRMLHLTMSPPW